MWMNVLMFWCLFVVDVLMPSRGHRGWYSENTVRKNRRYQCEPSDTHSPDLICHVTTASDVLVTDTESSIISVSMQEFTEGKGSNSCDNSEQTSKTCPTGNDVITHDRENHSELLETTPPDEVILPSGLRSAFQIEIKQVLQHRGEVNQAKVDCSPDSLMSSIMTEVASRQQINKSVTTVANELREAMRYELNETIFHQGLAPNALRVFLWRFCA